MDLASSTLLLHSLDLAARADNATSGNSTSSSSSTSSSDRPPIYKVIGICLAVASGLFIGVSFVIKKIGLLKANAKYNEEAGEGYGYLKNAWWWTGMTLMILGETCNFVAYAFTDAILVTPLGALSVVVTTILSAIFLKERLSFVGKVSCLICILGSLVIVLNAPQQSAVKDIQQMQQYVISPGFLSYAGVIIVACIIIVFFVAPKWGKKSMLVYLSVCSLIGGLSVVATQGLGSAILAQVNGESEFNQWFLYVLFVFVICTLLTEIIYLNKALNIFNAALVTPTYYVYFTSSTIVASAVLFQGFHGSAMQIIDVVVGFLIICSGVILLQLAKSSKDVPDAAVFKGDLDQVRTVAEQEEPEYEPRADTIRGGASIVRALSRVRTMRQADETRRIYEERMAPIGEGEEFEWDGLRRRRTVSTARSASVQGGGTKTVHPPLGMSHFPADDDAEEDSTSHPGFFGRFAGKSHTFLGSQHKKQEQLRQQQELQHPGVPLENVYGGSPIKDDPEAGYGARGYTSVRKVDEAYQQEEEDTAYHGAHIRFTDPVPRHTASPGQGGGSSLAPPPHDSPNLGNEPGARRAFSFQNVFHRHKSAADDRPTSRGALSFISSGGGAGAARTGSAHSGGSGSRHDHSYPGTSGDGATEEERAGLVQGDSSRSLVPRRLGGMDVVEEPVDERDDEGDEDEGGDSDGWFAASGTAGSSPQDLGGDLGAGRQRGRGRGSDDPFHDYDDDDDDGYMYYDESLKTPVDYRGRETQWR